MTKEELEAVVQLEYPKAYIRQWGHYAAIDGAFDSTGVYLASGLSPEDAINNLADRYARGIRTK